MGRPSVATERRRQIIEAVLRTLAANGISGATMDRIAAEAGMARGHVRHFVGNRDDLLVATAQEIFSDDAGGVSFLPRNLDTLDDTLDYLFGGEFVAPESENAAVVSLLEASHLVPKIAEVMAEAYTAGHVAITAMVSEKYPDLDADTCDRAAYGILTVALGNIFLADLEATPARSQAARAVVDQLLASIHTPTETEG